VVSPFVIIWKRIGIDYVHANELEIIDGVLTGKYLGEIVVKESRVFESYC
jgi:phosphoserine phosphatase